MLKNANKKPYLLVYAFAQTILDVSVAAIKKNYLFSQIVYTRVGSLKWRIN